MQAEYIRFYHLFQFFHKHLLHFWWPLHPLTLLIGHHWISQELPVNHLLSLAHLLHKVGWANIRDCVYTSGWSQFLWVYTFCPTQQVCRQNMTGQRPQAQQMSWEHSGGVKGALLRIPFGSLSFNTGLISSQFQRPLSIWHTRVVMGITKTEPDSS